jgi:hypothetical protein
MQNHHFYGSNVAEWKTSDNLVEVIDHFQKDAFLPYSIWLVPLEADAHYQIRRYAPDVDGSLLLGTFKKKKVFQPE